MTRLPLRMPHASVLAPLLLALSALASFPAVAADHEAPQKGKAFVNKQLNIKVGDRVIFRNDDAVPHNIFSLSDPMTFDLGTYNPGQSKDVTFNKEGRFEIECAIHPNMKMTVVVTK